MTDEQKIQAIRDYIKDHSEDGEVLHSDALAVFEDLKLILGEEEVVPPDYVGWHRWALSDTEVAEGLQTFALAIEEGEILEEGNAEFLKLGSMLIVEAVARLLRK